MSRKTIVFKSNDTWNKLGFVYYNDSRQFRRVLDNNPAWSIGSIPAEGDIVYVDDTSTGGTNVGQLESMPITDFAGAGSPRGTRSYPWKDLRKLYRRLSQYVPQALVDVNELNGFYFQ